MELRGKDARAVALPANRDGVRNAGLLFGQDNDLRYGGERVERVIERGAEPEYIEAIPWASSSATIRRTARRIWIPSSACATSGGVIG